MLERLWSIKMLLAHFMKGWVTGCDFLDKVLFVGEGNLCVKVAYGAFPKVFIV